MNLERHVTSLDLSRRLKELGVPQDSLYFWHEHYGTDQPTLAHESNVSTAHPKFSAFLTSELGEMLPEEVDGYSWRTLKTPRKGAWEIKYRKRQAGRFHPTILHQLSDPRETDARARMLVWLIEARLVDPKKL